MKQEKKQTVFFDLETKLEPWQKQMLSRINRDIKKGEPIIIAYGRRTGKSHMAAMYMAGMGGLGGTAVFGSSWLEWEDTFVWPWDRKESVESDKKIWGRIMVRKNVAMYGPDGTIAKEYATKKEVFQRKLRGED